MVRECRIRRLTSIDCVEDGQLGAKKYPLSHGRASRRPRIDDMFADGSLAGRDILIVSFCGWWPRKLTSTRTDYMTDGSFGGAEMPTFSLMATSRRLRRCRRWRPINTECFMEVDICRGQHECRPPFILWMAAAEMHRLGSQIGTSKGKHASSLTDGGLGRQ